MKKIRTLPFLGLILIATSLLGCSNPTPSETNSTTPESSETSMPSSESKSEIAPYFSVDIPTIAHKGYHTQALENSEQAFIEAGKRNFIGIETDIYWTKDGYIVCHHDPVIKGMDKPISELTYEEIMQHNFSGDPENPVRICTFNRYLEICRDYNKIPVIEFKVTPSKNNCEFLLRIIEVIYDDASAIDNVIFISFGLMICQRMKEIAEDNGYKYEIYLLAQNEKACDDAVESGLNLSYQWDLIDQTIADKVHNAGLKLAAWTLNDEKHIQKMKDFGCVTVTTDVLECDPKYLK